MNRYIALLRGINVSGQKKILMADLRSLFESLGYRGVRTYIQSGNVVFSHSAPRRGLETQISRKIKEAYGWDVPVLVRTSAEITEVLQDCPFEDEKMKKSYFTLFQEQPEDELILAFREISFAGEEFVLEPKCLYYFCATGYAKAKMTNKLIEVKLQTRVTTRNYNTLSKLVELAG